MTNTEIYRKAVYKINQELNGFYVPRLIIDREILDDCEIYYNIFSHDFAKAFWGEEYPEDFDYGDYGSFRKEYWKQQLTWLVVEPEPLKYLEKFL